MSSAKRKHKTLSIEEKIQLLKLLEEGTSVRRLCKFFSVGSSTIYDIKRKKDDLLKFYSERQSKKGVAVRKTMKEGKCSELERALVAWFELRKSEGETITGGMLVEQAKKFHEELKMNFECKYSHGWLDKFKNRHGIKLYTADDEKLAAASETNSVAFPEECSSFASNEEWMQNSLHDKLISSAELDASENFVKKFSLAVTSEELHSEQVYSASQTMLPWRQMPDEILNSETSGINQYRDLNETVAVFSCFNATGTHRCKLLVVGRSPKSKAFKGVQILPAIYRANKENRVTREIMIDWLENHFATEANAYCTTLGLAQDCKILLVLDSSLAPSHEEFLVIDNVHILFFKFHASISIQPQDQGISRWLKCWYRLEFLTCYLESIINGKSALEFNGEFNMKDSLWALARAWENVSETSLRHSWHKIWPDLMYEDAAEKEIAETYIFYKLKIINPIVENVKRAKKNLAKYICCEGLEEWVEGVSLGNSEDHQQVESPMKLSDKGESDCETDKSDPEESASSVESCIHLTSQLISGLEKQSFITEQEIMYLYRLKANLIAEKLKHRKAETKVRPSHKKVTEDAKQET